MTWAVCYRGALLPPCFRETESAAKRAFWKAAREGKINFRVGNNAWPKTWRQVESYGVECIPVLILDYADYLEILRAGLAAQRLGHKEGYQEGLHVGAGDQ